MNIVNTSITAQSITYDDLTYDDTPGYFVLATDHEVVTGTQNATADATTGDISNDTIQFGNGDGDFIEEGQAIATAYATDSTGKATANASAVGDIAHDVITFGSGNNDSVDILANAAASAFATSKAAATSIASGSISNDSIALITWNSVTTPAPAPAVLGAVRMSLGPKSQMWKA
jgi:hypothetical protein